MVYQLVVSLAFSLIVGPLVLAVGYQLIGLTENGVLGNAELANFLRSPAGLLSIALVGGALVGLTFVEYAGLIVLADQALSGGRVSLDEAALRTLRAGPRLVMLGVAHVVAAMVVALPFAALAALTYWLLLTDADINYYFERRPWQFWLAGAAGAVLAAGFLISAACFFARWAMAVPAAVVEGRSWREAIAQSKRQMRGRARPLAAALVGWLALTWCVLLTTTWLLYGVNRLLAAGLEGSIAVMMWGTAGVLLLDAVVLSLLKAIGSVGMAAIIARQYRLVAAPVVAVAEPATSCPVSQPAWRVRAGLVGTLLLGPVLSAGIALTLLDQFAEDRQTRVCAHRAGSSAAPENSLAALRKSMVVGADYVEIDVQQTADGHVVLLHDRDLRRVTGDRRNLADVNLADLKTLRLRDRSGTSDERIPTLDEFLAASGDRMRVNIELKIYGGDGQGLAQAVLEAVERQAFQDRAVVTCFDLPPLGTIKQADAELPVGIILAAVKGDMTRLPVDILSLNSRLVTGRVVRRAHRRGMEVFAWSVSDRQEALRLLDLGCDVILTNDPALLRELVDWHAGLSDFERMWLRIRRWLRE